MPGFEVGDDLFDPPPDLVGGFLTSTATGAVEGGLLGAAGGAAGHGLSTTAKNTLADLKPTPTTPSPPRPATLTLEGVEYPAVPEDAIGRPVETGKGLRYPIPPGTEGLSNRVTEIRIMDPTTTGRYPHPSGYAVYMNKNEQGIHPGTGQTLPRYHPARNIEFPDP